MMIEKRSCGALVLDLHLSWVSARSSIFAQNGGDLHGVTLLQSGTSIADPSSHMFNNGQAETNLEMLPSSKHPRTLSQREQEIRSSEEDGNQMGVSKIGSRPPRCEHKCYGCTPCEATQVPATHDGHTHVRVQYTNYQPAGWKCKCGPSLYAP